jgi:hypothetical protein
MDYNPPAFSASPVQSSGPNWLSIIGGGLGKFGQGVGSGTTPVPSGGDVPQMGQQDYSQPQQPPAQIPQNNLVEALMRLLSGG